MNQNTVSLMNRRQFTSLACATLFPTIARAQELTDGTRLPPSPENLDKELPSTLPGPKACDFLAELPVPPTASVNEKSGGRNRSGDG